MTTETAPNRETGCPACGQLGKHIGFASAPNEYECENSLCRVVRFDVHVRPEDDADMQAAKAESDADAQIQRLNNLLG